MDGHQFTQCLNRRIPVRRASVGLGEECGDYARMRAVTALPDRDDPELLGGREIRPQRAIGGSMAIFQ